MKPPAKLSPAPVGRALLDGQRRRAERMPSDAECAIPKENRRAVFAMLDDQRLRAHLQHLVRGARQAGYLSASILASPSLISRTSTPFSISISSSRCAVDPVIHGVATDQFYAIHLLAHIALQHGMDVGQEKIIGVVVLCGNLRLKFSKTLSSVSASWLRSRSRRTRRPRGRSSLSPAGCRGYPRLRSSMTASFRR